MIKYLGKKGSSQVLVITKEMRAHLGISDSRVQVDVYEGHVIVTKPQPQQPELEAATPINSENDEEPSELDRLQPGEQVSFDLEETSKAYQKLVDASFYRELTKEEVATMNLLGRVIDRSTESYYSKLIKSYRKATKPAKPSKTVWPISNEPIHRPL